MRPDRRFLCLYIYNFKFEGSNAIKKNGRNNIAVYAVEEKTA